MYANRQSLRVGQTIIVNEMTRTMLVATAWLFRRWIAVVVVVLFPKQESSMCFPRPTAFQWYHVHHPIGQLNETGFPARRWFHVSGYTTARSNPIRTLAVAGKSGFLCGILGISYDEMATCCCCEVGLYLYHQGIRQA